jgi:NAD-dependent deacetylase
MSDFSDTLVERLRTADHVAVLTGAGISAESGIPTFRDPDGIWEQFDPQELANVEAFLENPELVQGWYRHRRELAEETEPNPGHRALATLEAHVPDFTLITQNVDDLHHQAGSERVVELHGNITRNYCIDCERESSGDEIAAIAEGEAARCPECDGLIRPDVVWFGERLPRAAIDAAQEAAERAEVFLSVGTSAIVYPAAGFPLTATEHGAYTAEVNVESTAITEQMDEFVQGKAGVVLPDLVAAVTDADAVRE